MTPRFHKRLALVLFVAILVGVSWLLNPFFALIAAGIFHKAVVENLPLRCPKCGGKAKLTVFESGRAQYQEEFRSMDTWRQDSWYRCLKCPWESEAGL